MNKRVVQLLRVVVSAGLLVWVFLAVDVRHTVEEIASARVEWVLAALAVSSLGNLFGAWRWQLLLRSQGREAPVLHLFGSYLVGLFFNNFLPSTIGGDVIRATSAKKKGGGTLTENLTVVLVERMIGLFATLTFGGLAALSGVAGELDPRVPWLLGIALFVSMAGIYLAISRRVRKRLIPLVERVPIAFIRRTLVKMIAAFEMFSRARPTLVANYVVSLAFQFLLIVHFWLIQFAFGESIPFVTFLVVVPLVFCVMMLPVGINGLGVREGAFVWLMTRAGMAPGTALALSLASYAIAVVQGLAGGVIHLVREVRDRESPKPEDDTTTAPAP